MLVQLAQDWTDPQGVTHPAGTTVDVDAATLAQLEETGYVTDDWAGPTEGGDWAGPTGGGV